MRKVFDGNMYNGHELVNSDKGHQGYYAEILDYIQLLLDGMINRHSSVLFVRFELKYPAGSSSLYPDDNDLVSKFSETFTLYCNRHRYDPKYIWVRELSGTGQVHYHFMLLLNGNIIQNTHQLILGYATNLWQKYLGIEDGKGLVHLCRSKVYDYFYDDHYGGVKIKRKDPHFQQIYAKCYHVASYLAKCYSKGGAPAHINEFGRSRIG